jgi:hypothetical protein
MWFYEFLDKQKHINEKYKIIDQFIFLRITYLISVEKGISVIEVKV